jgi:hypothetical protein
VAEKYAGTDWVEGTLHIEMSPFGRKVADILGQVWRGIYHLDQGGTRLCKVDWTDDRFIRITVTGELATFDSQHLTELVLAAHDGCVRVSVGACNMQRLQLNFSRRTARDGDLFSRHPTIETAVAAWRAHLALEEPREKISDEEFERQLRAKCESCERKAIAAAWNPASGLQHPCCFGCDTGADLEDLLKKAAAGGAVP